MSNVLTYKGYIGSAEIDVESGTCHGRLLYIRDVIAYSADTPKDLKAAFEEAVDDYLEMSLELGHKPERPCSGTFNVRIPPELHMAANLAARREKTTLNALVKDALSVRIASPTIRHDHTHTVVVQVTGEWQDVQLTTLSDSGVQPWSH